MNLAEARPFTFDISFDEEENQRKRKLAQKQEEERLAQEEEARQMAEPPAPTFSAEELQAAKAQAWQEGRDAGYSDAIAEREAMVTTQLESLSAQISGIFVHQDVSNEHIALDASETAISLLKRLLPHYSEQHGTEEIKAALAACMEQLTAQSRVTISVPEAQEETLKPHIEAVAARSGYDGRLIIIKDPDLGPAEVVARWDGGGMDRLDQTVWDAVETILQRARDNLPPIDGQPVPEAFPERSAGAGASNSDVEQEAKVAETERIRDAARMAALEPEPVHETNLEPSLDSNLDPNLDPNLETSSETRAEGPEVDPPVSETPALETPALETPEPEIPAEVPEQVSEELVAESNPT